MNWQISTKAFGGLRIVVDNNCFTRKITYRAVAVVVDVRRPNRVKPIYKQKRFEKIIPRVYKIHDMIVMHPTIYDAILKQMSRSIIEQERKALMSVYGIPDMPPQPKGLTLSDLDAVIKKFDAG